MHQAHMGERQWRERKRERERERERESERKREGTYTVKNEVCNMGQGVQSTANKE